MLQAGIDDRGDAHAILPNGRVTTIRRHAKKWPQAYYGICLGGWIEVATHASHLSVVEWILIVCGQLLLHEAWPRNKSRKRKALGDSAAEQIHKVL